MPIPVPTKPGTKRGDTAVSDPALDHVAEFFATVLEKYGAAAWAAVAPNEPLVRTVLKHNPERGSFNANELPCLFVYRGEQIRSERIAVCRRLLTVPCGMPTTSAISRSLICW